MLAFAYLIELRAVSSLEEGDENLPLIGLVITLNGAMHDLCLEKEYKNNE